MPRARAKAIVAASADLSKKTGKNYPLESSEDQPSTSKVDLSQFKFEKKQHHKIEFEKDWFSESSSPEKKDSKGLWEPANWEDFLLNLRNMRSNNDAPVDTMGCHMSGDKKAGCTDINV